MIPTKPSECVAALSLFQDGEEHPYVAIFYTMDEGELIFFGLRIHGVETNVDGEKFPTYDDQGCTDPDPGPWLICGTIMDDGGAVIERAEFNSEDDALTFIAVLRAAYQMVGELA